MATIRQSRRVNMEGWTPVAQNTPQPIPKSEEAQRTGRSPFMLSSMPYDAASQDVIYRQFYGGAKAPTNRIFIPGGR